MITRLDVEARLYRLNAGRYDLDGVYAVDRAQSGWRWFRHSDPSTGGEWRQTRREAVRDLAAFLNQPAQARHA